MKYTDTGHGQSITTNSTNSPEMRRPRRTGKFIPSAKVRAYVYGLMVASSPVVVYYGLATLHEVGLWIAFGGVALGVTNGVALANTGDK